MIGDFKLTIDKFGPIEHVDLDLSKINIITGCNASGNTAISKLIYCIITAFSRDGRYLTYKCLKDKLNQLIIDDNKDF